MKIIADTPTLYSPQEGNALGITVIPACTIINGTVYRDFEDISIEEFMEKITKRAMFEAIAKAMETGECEFAPEVVIAFCEKEIAALDSKAAKAKERAAAKKAEADVLMEQVKNALTDEFQTIADIAAVVAETNPDATISKTTYRLTKLVETQVAEKAEVSVPTADGKSRKVKAYRLIVEA